MTEFKIRPIDPVADRETLLEFHHETSYESAGPAFRKTHTFQQSRDLWYKGSGPEEYLADLIASLKDRRTIAEIWESDGQIIAYVWATFTDWPGYGVSGAHIEDILVTREFRRKGVALQVIRHVEELARERGATILRSGTGIENLASQAMHRKAGFYVERTEFEKEL